MKKTIFGFTIFLTVALNGCAAIQPVAFVGPSGKTAYSMKCSGLGRTIEKCYQKAGQVCPNGYSIVSTTSDTKAATINGQLYVAADRNLTIECK